MRMNLGLVAACLSLALTAPLTGCSAPSDTTQNKMDTGNADPNYPAGPYGYTEGSTMADYKFIGKTPTNGNYDAAPVRDLLLGEFHADASTKLLFLVGAALWCGPCNQEAPEVEALAEKYADQGVKVMTVLVEGSVRGLTSTPDDMGEWVTRHGFKDTVMGIDPEARLFQYAPASAFPVQIIVDTKTMKIKLLHIGGDLDAEAAVTDALATL